MRTSNVPRVHALDGFLTFVTEEYTYDEGENASLADYIHTWLWNGHAAMNCFGDFEIFLKVIPLIVDEWYRDPAILDFAGCSERNIPPIVRRAMSAFGSGNDLHAIFDRDNFTAAVFNWQHLTPSKS